MSRSVNTILMVFATLRNICSAGIPGPTITVGPCDPPVAQRSLSFCCVTENIPSAPVYFYRVLPIIGEVLLAKIEKPCHVVSIDQSLDASCTGNDNVTVYRLGVGHLSVATDVGVWGCKYYGNSSTYHLLQSQGRPRKPFILARNFTFEAQTNTGAAIFVCYSRSQSAAPPYYRPVMTIHWNLPFDNENVISSQKGSDLIFMNIDCGSNSSKAVACSVQEGGISSDTSTFFPYSACPMMENNEEADFRNPEREALVTVILVFGILFMCTCCICLLFGCRSLRMCCKWCGGHCEDLCSYTEYREFSDPWWYLCCCFCCCCCRPCIPCGKLGGKCSRYLCESDQCDTHCDCDSDEDVSDDLSMRSAHLRRPDSWIDDIEISEGEEEDPLDGDDQGRSALQNLQASLAGPQTRLRLVRNNLLCGLLEVYNDWTLAEKTVDIRLEGEMGVDLGGVSKDVYTTFWTEATEKFFRGYETVVPDLSPQRYTEERVFSKLGRIFAHSTAILGRLPIQICKSTLITIIYNTTDVDEQTLVEDFLHFVEPAERLLFQQALDNFASLSDHQREEHQSLFHRFDMECVLSTETYKELFVALARYQLCIKPKPLCDKIRGGIPESQLENFWQHLTLEVLSEMYEVFEITPANVIGKLKLRQTRGSRDFVVFEYLKTFINGLPKDGLKVFLQYVTGQNCVPNGDISVHCVHLSGLQRRPMAHTCGNRLDLPSNYSDFHDFDTEFRNVLSSEEARLLSIA